MVRYNWIEGGNRQLDLVETDSLTIQNSAAYRTTFVYGNVLIEPDAAGNRQIAHYGGDSGTTSKYRKGTLHFYNNTMVSYRTDRTTLFRLSTNDERADVRNNIFYVTAAGTHAVAAGRHRRPGPDAQLVQAGPRGDLRHAGGHHQRRRHVDRRQLARLPRRSRTGLPPRGRRRRRRTRERGWPPVLLPEPAIARQYVKHQNSEPRPNDGVLDLGAFEMTDGQLPNLVISTSSLPAGTAGTAYGAFVSATGGLAPYAWTIVAGSLPTGLSLNPASGAISGTPAAAGSSTFTVQVTDGQAPADVATAALSITVAAAPAPNPLSITTASLPNARRNKNYNRTLAATGGTTPYVLERSSPAACRPGCRSTAAPASSAGAQPRSASTHSRCG